MFFDLSPFVFNLDSRVFISLIRVKFDRFIKEDKKKINVYFFIYKTPTLSYYMDLICC